MRTAGTILPPRRSAYTALGGRVISRELDGRYRILAKLGEGAMGEVYLVEHIGLGRKEALKILRSTMDDSPSLVTRFRREARATNRLQHPNIVAVYDFGRLPDGRFYITTEYVEGENLDVILRQAGALSTQRALNILVQLSDAIDHAHSRGVIHRDLKPANLIIGQGRGKDEVIKVLDFGVAKIIAPDYAESIATTGQGEVFGTPAYMAPEQIGARGNDPRIDIYAFGCISFEILTGSPPFIGRTLQVLNAHLNTPPPRPSTKRPQSAIPSLLDDVVLRCLAKDPAQRPQTGGEIASALASLRAGAAAVSAAAEVARRRVPVSSFGGPAEHTFPEPGDRWATETTTADFDKTAQAEDIGLAPTGFVDRSDARRAVDAVLVQLTEALIDGGCSDFQLTITMANLAGARGALEAVVARMEELERAREAVAKRTQESEKRFRFAVGELRFELEQARQKGAVTPDIEYQLIQLETRMAELTAQAEREVSAIDDRAITLAADRAHYEEELASLLGTLDNLVDEQAPRFTANPQIAELFQRLARVRKAMTA
jgi:tRNA A-37 threonylcarbamoyl transferase component Bud32